MNPSPPPRDSPAAIAALLGAGLLAIPLGSLSLLLLVTAQTGRGRIFALAALAIVLCPLAAALAHRRAPRAWRRTALVLFLGWAGVTLWLGATAPGGDMPGSARVFHAYADQTSHFNRLALGNLLPEVDQLLLGFTLMPAADPLLTAAQASRLKAATAAVYAELESDGDFHALGSVLPLAYAELRGAPAGALHTFVYIPARLDRTAPAPVIVFFHGSGGNFKGYLWVLAHVADRLGFVIVAPSFGLGNWREPESIRRLDAALATVARILPIDRRQVHAIGLSNGGLAASQVLASSGRELRSLVFISPVFDEAEIRTLPDGLEGKPVLVLSGQLDDRVPVGYVRENVDRLRRRGARVELKLVDDADHFLIFSHRQLVVGELSAWLESVAGPR